MPTGMLCYWLLVCSVYSVTIGMLFILLLVIGMLHLFCYWLLVCSVYCHCLLVCSVYSINVYGLLVCSVYSHNVYSLDLYRHALFILLMSIGRLCLFC